MKERLTSLSERISVIKSKIKNEEATKQSLILPMLSILGYDIFDPDEVVPEVPCDITNKGDRIDYIICKDGKHAILIECKDWRQNLDNHVSQLRKYYVASEARFAILTNGIKYLFFSDHDKANIMDEKPFYSLDISALSDDDIVFLSGFKKESFNTMQLLFQSQDIKYRDAILNNLKREFANPSKGFVSLLTSDFYKGKLHESIYNKFSCIVKDCLDSILTVDFYQDDKVIKEEEETQEIQGNYTDDELNLINIVLGWLHKYECDGFRIYVRKRADGFISFCYNSRWWNICRIKIRPKFDNKIRAKICKEGLANNYSERYLKDSSELPSIRFEIESQCEDTKSRFFKYRMEHGY